MTTVYTGSTFIGAEASEIEISELNVPRTGVTGRTLTGEAKVKNNGDCDITVSLEHDGSTFGTVEQRSGSESYGDDFDIQLPDVVTQSYEVVVTANRDGEVVASESDTILVESLSERFSIDSVTFDGDIAGGKQVEGSVTVSNSDTDSQDVTVFVDGEDNGGSSIRSDRSRTLDFEYTPPQVDQRQSVDVPIEIRVGNEVVAETVSSIDVQPLSDFITVGDINIPDEANSEEEFSGYDSTVSVETDIGGVDVSLLYEGDEVGSNSFRSAGSRDIRIEIQMPQVDAVEDVEVTIDGEVDGQSVGESSKTVTVSGPAAQVSIDNIDAPDEAISGDSVDMDVKVSNDSSEEQTVTLEYEGGRVASDSIRGGRDNTFDLNVDLPEVDAVEDIEISLDAVVGDILADTSATSITVSNISEKIEIQDSDIDEEALSGDTVEGGIRVFNDSDRSLDIEISVDGTVERTRELGSGSTRTLDYTYEVPEVDETEDVTVEVGVIVRGETVGLVEETVTVSHRAEFIDIESLGLPNSIVGGKSGEGVVTLSNSNSNRIEANVEYDGNLVSSEPKGVRESVDAEFKFIFETEETEEEAEKDITVLAIVDGRVADTADGTVTTLPPEDEEDEDSGDEGGDVVNNHFKIDTEGGEIRVKNNYVSSVTVEGSVVGSGITMSETLQTNRPLGILPGRFADSFSGDLQSETNETVIEFSNIRRIKVETSKPFTFSVDGETKGKGKSYSENFTR